MLYRVTLSLDYLDIIREITYFPCSRVLILYGNSKIGSHVQNEISILICFIYLFRSTSVADFNLFSVKNLFYLHTCAACAELPSTIDIMLRSVHESE